MRARKSPCRIVSRRYYTTCHMCDLLVVARFHENTTWARAMAPEVLEYTKKIGNIGRESQSYVRFILEEHRSPRPNATRVCFSQGRVGGIQRSGVLVRPRDFSDDVYEPIFGSGRRWKFNRCGGPKDCLPCLFGVTRSIGVALRCPQSRPWAPSSPRRCRRCGACRSRCGGSCTTCTIRTARVGCRTSWSGSGSPSCEANLASESCQAKIPF